MPPKNNIIHAKGIGKRYKLYHQAVSGPIKEFLFPWRREQFYKSFWAVEDVDLEIQRGEIVGVVGPNGSGKTTLLKMIAGLLPVDRGTLSVQGRVTALLALGVGVHPEFSGLENAYFNGLLLGMRREEIKSKMDEIIEFAEIGEFIHQPFRTYSAGMKARLLFAVAMSVRPEILIVDEALATGDAYFLNKSREKIRELCRCGATILFVSHNMQQIEELCSRAILMIEGKMSAIGSASEVIAEYNRRALSRLRHRLGTEPKTQLGFVEGTGEILLEAVQLLDPMGEERQEFRSGEALIIRMTFVKSPPKSLFARIWVGLIDPRTQEWVAELGSADEWKQVSVSHGMSAGAKVQFQNHRTVLDFKLDQIQVQNGEFGLWIIVQDGESRKFCEHRNPKTIVVGGRIQSILIGQAKFWHPYRLKAVEA